MNMRVNGSVTLCSGSEALLHLRCSIPITPSVEMMFGQVRVISAGRWPPWKSTSILRLPSSRATR